jgi:hypothetical protein
MNPIRFELSSPSIAQRNPQSKVRKSGSSTGAYLRQEVGCEFGGGARAEAFAFRWGRVYLFPGRGKVRWNGRNGKGTRIDEGDGFPPFSFLLEQVSTSCDLKGDADADSGLLQLRFAAAFSYAYGSLTTTPSQVPAILSA